MSSQLLGELLLDRHNFTIMTKYISKPENLKLMMNLLRDKSRNIQFEAFHVFKVEYWNRKQYFPLKSFVSFHLETPEILLAAFQYSQWDSSIS